MNNFCVRAENLSKRFLIMHSKPTTLKLIKACLSPKFVKKELWALRNVTFEIKKGDKVALVGKNGSGKTTLLRLICGIYAATSGRLEIKTAPHPLFTLSGLNQELSVIENIYLFGAIHGLDRKFLREKLSQIIELAELQDLQYMPLKNLSSGQHRRLALSIFFQVSADFFIFDEGFTSVDYSFVQKCQQYLSKMCASDATVILSSHNMPLLKQYCRRALWFKDGHLQMDAGIEEVIAAYERP